MHSECNFLCYSSQTGDSIAHILHAISNNTAIHPTGDTTQQPKHVAKDLDSSSSPIIRTNTSSSNRESVKFLLYKLLEKTAYHIGMQVIAPPFFCNYKNLKHPPNQGCPVSFPLCCKSMTGFTHHHHVTLHYQVSVTIKNCNSNMLQSAHPFNMRSKLRSTTHVIVLG